jgi:putative PEP-CTERM system histidine kinase
MLSAITAFSHSIAAAAFLLLFVLLLAKWRRTTHSVLLAGACLLTALWAAAIAYAARHGMPVSLFHGILEIARNAGWSMFLLSLLGQPQRDGFTASAAMLRQRACYATLYALLIAATIISYSGAGKAASIAGFISGNLGHVGMAIMGMLLIEQLFRNTIGKERWAIKFSCLGIGGLFAYDFYFYVDALLFNRINPELWTARGLVHAFAVPLIAVSAARNPYWSTGISLSRRFLFHSATLIGSAAYLLVVSVAGYYLRFFGGDWGMVLQTTLLFVAGVFLVVVLFSGAFRSWLKVSISKHFYNYSYDYREEWLRFTRTLSIDGPELGERAIRAIAELIESPKGVLYLRSEHGQYVPEADWNLTCGFSPVSGSEPLCDFLKRSLWVVDLAELASRPDRYEGLTVPSWLQRFPDAWLIVPLVQHSDLFGFVVLARSRSKVALNWEVLDLLKIAGSQAASHLARQKSADALAVASQFETFNRLSTFVVHDLKNLVAQLALLVANAEQHKHSPEFQKDMMETIEHAVQKMRLLLQKFHRESSVQHAQQVSLDWLLRQAAASKKSDHPRLILDIRQTGLVVSADAGRLERVIGHLIQNAIEATPREGQITVRVSGQASAALIEVADTGRGMSAEFIRTRLFKPFESTKSAGMGIGVFETREYVHQIGGQLEVESVPDIGTTFRVTLPLCFSEEEKLSAAA